MPYWSFVGVQPNDQYTVCTSPVSFSMVLVCRAYYAERARKHAAGSIAHYYLVGHAAYHLVCVNFVDNHDAGAAAVVRSVDSEVRIPWG